MSNRLGMILPKEIPDEILKAIRFRYDFDLIKINNETMNIFLNDKEEFYILHKYGEQTGISRYKTYIRFYLEMAEYIRTCGLDVFYFTKYEHDYFIKDAAKWVKILHDIKFSFDIETFGIINFYENNLTELNEFKDIKRKIIPLKEVDVITLMQLECNVIYMFK